MTVTKCKRTPRKTTRMTQETPRKRRRLRTKEKDPRGCVVDNDVVDNDNDADESVDRSVCRMRSDVEEAVQCRGFTDLEEADADRRVEE